MARRPARGVHPLGKALSISVRHGILAQEFAAGTMIWKIDEFD
jgi:hypothetical protein